MCAPGHWPRFISPMYVSFPSLTRYFRSPIPPAVTRDHFPSGVLIERPYRPIGRFLIANSPPPSVASVTPSLYSTSRSPRPTGTSAAGALRPVNSLAITGSVDQRGHAQAIGGVNEKIEGFFDACRLGGLTGEQGVLVPESNLAHLMLRADVVEAVEAGNFRIFAFGNVDDCLELLSGLPAGKRGADGLFPEGSFNRRVEDRLAALAALKAAQERKARPARRRAGGSGV